MIGIKEVGVKEAGHLSCGDIFPREQMLVVLSTYTSNRTKRNASGNTHRSEIPRTDRQNKKHHPVGWCKVREFAPSDKLPTWKDGAMLRTHSTNTQCVFVLCSMTDGHKKRKAGLKSCGAGICYSSVGRDE